MTKGVSVATIFATRTQYSRLGVVRSGRLGRPNRIWRIYKLIGTEWAEQFEKEMQGKNDEAPVYPNYLAPVAIDRDSVRTTKEDVERWLTGTLDKALELQRPADDAAIVIRKERVAA
jgi:hypothetical protein